MKEVASAGNWSSVQTVHGQSCPVYRRPSCGPRRRQLGRQFYGYIHLIQLIMWAKMKDTAQAAGLPLAHLHPRLAERVARFHLRGSGIVARNVILQPPAQLVLAGVGGHHRTDVLAAD